MFIHCAMAQDRSLVAVGKNLASQVRKPIQHRCGYPVNLTAVGILIDISSFSVDNSLDEVLQFLILRKQLVQMSKLIASISQPLSTADGLVGLRNEPLAALQHVRNVTSDDEGVIDVCIKVSHRCVKG